MAWRESKLAAQTHTYLKHAPAWRVAGRSLGAIAEPLVLARLRDCLASARMGDRPFGELPHPDLVATLRLRERTLSQRLVLRGDMRQGGWRGYLPWMWGNPGFMRGMAGCDMAAARWGLEARHPWSDVRVLEPIARMPLNALVHDGWTKRVARKAYEPELGEVGRH